jgi:hypothetical protein
MTAPVPEVTPLRPSTLPTNCAELAGFVSCIAPVLAYAPPIYNLVAPSLVTSASPK